MYETNYALICLIICSFSIEEGYINFDLMLRHLFIDGKYSLDGQILLFPVHGSGKVIGNFSKIINLSLCG